MSLFFLDVDVPKLLYLCQFFNYQDSQNIKLGYLVGEKFKNDIIFNAKRRLEPLLAMLI